MESDSPRSRNSLNAREVVNLQEVPNAEWKQIRSEYRIWQKRLGVFSDYTLLGIGVVSAFISYHFWHSKGRLHEVIVLSAGMVSLYTYTAICKHEGHREGYEDGYRDGHHRGVNRAIGISDEDEEELREIAADMELHDLMEKRGAQAPPDPK